MSDDSKVPDRTRNRRANALDREHNLIRLAEAHGFTIIRRGIAYHLTRGGEAVGSGDLDCIEMRLGRALRERRDSS